MNKLYTDFGEERIIGRGCEYMSHIVVCNACGAHTLNGNIKDIKHYQDCGGVAEINKWNKYYSTRELS